MSGWIKLHRSIQDHFIYDFSEPDKAMAWIDILLSASYQESKVKVKSTLFTVSKGQWLVSQVTLQKRWRMSQNKVKRLLKLLENDGMISLNTNDLTSVITICNYNDYQNDERPIEQSGERAGERGTDEQANDIQRNKEFKEGKEVKDIVYSDESPAVKTPCKATEVFEHWKVVMNHPKAVLDEKRIKLIKKWFKAGYSPEALMDSITGYTKSPHHMGQNDSGTKYDSIELLLRDAGKIDAGLKHLETANNPGESNVYKTNSGLNRHEKLQKWSVDTTERLERELAALREQEAAGISCDGEQEFIPYLPDVDS